MIDEDVPPSPDCELPEPVRPEGEMMTTATCPHCNVLFLLVTSFGGNKWLEAQSYWDGVARRQGTTQHYYFKEPPRGYYRQYREDTDYGDAYKNIHLEDWLINDMLDIDDQAE